MKWTVTIPPAVMPVTYSQAKRQLRIDHDLDQDLINDYIASATAFAETECQISLINRTITATFYQRANAIVDYAGPNFLLRLPRGPVQSVTSLQTPSGSNVAYEIRRIGTQDYLRPLGGAPLPLVAVYVAGYGSTPASVPADIRQAILSHVSHLYNNRDADVAAIPEGLKYVYQRYQAQAA